RSALPDAEALRWALRLRGLPSLPPVRPRAGDRTVALEAQSQAPLQPQTPAMGAQARAHGPAQAKDQGMADERRKPMRKPKDRPPVSYTDMLIALRGGLPDKCDFCGLPYEGTRYPVPEEAGAWSCNKCEAAYRQ